MKKLLTILLLLFIVNISFAQVKVGSEGNIIPTGIYPAVKAHDVKGTLHYFKTLVERNALPANFRDTGMLAYVGDSAKFYYLNNSINNTAWTEWQGSGGGGGSGCTTFYVTSDSLYFVRDSCGTLDSTQIVGSGDAISQTQLNDTAAAIRADIPEQFNPIAGTNISLSGTYPNITFNASGSTGVSTVTGNIVDNTDPANPVVTGIPQSVISDTLKSYATSGSITTDNVIYSTPISLSVANHLMSGSFALKSQSAYTLFGRGSGSGTPSFLSSIDSNWVTGLHTEAYYNTKYSTAAGSKIWYGTTTGNNSYSTTITGLTALSAGQYFVITFIAASASSINTLNVNGLGTIGLKKGGTTNMTSTDITANTSIQLFYDGTYFQMVAPSVGNIAYLNGVNLYTSNNSFSGQTTFTGLTKTYLSDYNSNLYIPQGYSMAQLSSVLNVTSDNIWARVLLGSGDGNSHATTGTDVTGVLIVNQTTATDSLSNYPLVSSLTVKKPGAIHAGATAADAQALYVDSAPTDGTNNWSINAGRAKIRAGLTMTSTTEPFYPPRMTSAQRDAMTGITGGALIVCSDCTATDGSTGVLQQYQSSTSTWKNAF